MFKGGRCFQEELRVVLIVVSVLLANEVAVERTAENLVVSLPYLSGRKYGAYGNLLSARVLTIHWCSALYLSAVVDT